MENRKKVRPKAIEGLTEMVDTGCGHLYVTVNFVENKPFEIFARLGKVGSCGYCQMEALTRAISRGLRYDVPIDEYIKQLEEIKCPSSTISNGEKIMSCADAIAKVLKKHIKNDNK